MGIEMGFLVLRPAHHAEEKYRLWRPAAFFGGYASWPGADGEMPIGSDRADLCMVSWVYQHILRHSNTQRRECFAPRFTIPEEAQETYGFRDSGGWLTQEGSITCGEHIALPLWHLEYQRGYPDYRTRKAHNYIVSLPDHEYGEWQEGQYEPGIEPPFVWVHCQVFAEWLRGLDRMEGHAAQDLLRHDLVARTLIRSRRAYLEHMATIGCHMVCVPECPSEMGMAAFL